jgi:hypothetical protein
MLRRLPLSVSASLLVRPSGRSQPLERIHDRALHVAWGRGGIWTPPRQLRGEPGHRQLTFRRLTNVQQPRLVASDVDGTLLVERQPIDLMSQNMVERAAILV